jgi:ABC-type phosphate transport system substrate-binding protein
MTMLTLGGRGRAVAALVIATFAALVATVSVAAPSGAAVGEEQIQGTGSSWAANAVNQWIADVSAHGPQVIYTADGSAAGRQDFANGDSDFGVTDVQYRGFPDVPHRDYVLVPLVAGGTAFPYHVEDGGKLVTGLRLSGATLAKIFTLQITNWADPAITRDNNGRQLPNLPITPVVHSEGTGSTLQFTTFLARQYPALWDPFSGSADRTEYFPYVGHAGFVAQNGSAGVMNYVTSPAANGAIGYDEYSYPKNIDYPVAKIANAAGYYTLPTDGNVAVALTQAQIDTTDVNDPNKYLTEVLDNVYTNPDPRTYPLSSYSYAIIPTAKTGQNSFEPSRPETIDTGQRQSLVDFLGYAVCAGQRSMGKIGYAPLPKNLVQAAFDQLAKLKAADPAVDDSALSLSTCANPTITGGGLAATAPQPPACDKDGQGPCDVTVNGGGSAISRTNPAPPCTVPKLPHKATAAQARTALKSAHCRAAHDLLTGKGYPKAPKGKHWVVTGFALEHYRHVHRNSKDVVVRSFTGVPRGAKLAPNTALVLVFRLA